jgi:hypothetical protein
MKKYFKNLGYLMVLSVLITLVSSCEKLPVQEKFVFNPEVKVLTPFKDLTAMQFLELDPGKEFHYMRQIIHLAGMESYYSADVKDRTYFLLRDTAFIEGYPKRNRNTYSGLIKDLTGKSNGDLTKVDTARLIKLLKYHILDQYVDQGPAILKKKQTYYLFHSLLPGDDGRVYIKRNEFLQFTINQTGDLPNSKMFTNEVEHGYIFKNGIGHLLGQYIRVKPF